MATWVFTGICFLGAGILAVSVFLGELFDADTGDLHPGEVEHAAGGPSIFSGRVMAAFLTGFGGGGAIASIYGCDILRSSFWGMGTGVAMGGVVLTMARFLFGQQASSSVGMGELVGREGQVTIAIPAGGTGQARFEVKGSLSDFPAQSASGAAVPAGTAVAVARVVGGTLMVDPKG